MMTHKLSLYVCLTLALGTTLYSTIAIIEQEIDQSEHCYFLALKGSYEQAAGNNSQAAQTYIQLKKILPQGDHSFALATLKLAFDRGKFEDITKHNLVLDLANPYDKEISFITAQAHLFLDQTDVALNLLKQLIARYPNDDRFDYFTVLAYMKTNKNNKALSLIDTILSKPERSSKQYLFHFLKAKIAFTQNNLATAKRECKTSLQKNPTSAKPLQLLAIIAEKKENYTKALSLYEKYLRLMPSDMEVANAMAALAIKTGNHTKAEELLATYPNATPRYFHNKALVHLTCKQYELAAQAVEEALKRDPMNLKIQELKSMILKLLPLTSRQ